MVLIQMYLPDLELNPNVNEKFYHLVALSFTFPLFTNLFPLLLLLPTGANPQIGGTFFLSPKRKL